MLEQYVKKILTSRVYDVAVETPLQSARQLSERLGNSIWLKREDLQPVFSFKIRGAYNKLTQLSDEERARGVVTASAGNHAQGLALAAKVLGVKATIVMPKVHPLIAPLAYAVPVQLLAYHVAVLKGTDVDQPRNLAKSVTVE